MSNMKYRIIFETFEVAKETPKSEIISKAVESGLQNGKFKIIGIYDTFEQAQFELDSYKTWCKKLHTIVSWLWELNLYYIDGIDDDNNLIDCFYCSDTIDFID